MVRALARDPANIEAKIQARELIYGTWVDVMVSSDQDAARNVAAAKLDDRLHGAAKQSVDLSMRDVPADQMTDDELASIAARGRVAHDDAEGNQG